MERYETLNLNLAKYPVRNKRFFSLLSIVLFILSAFLLGLNTVNFLGQSHKIQEVRKSIMQIEKERHELETKKVTYSNKIRLLEKKYEQEVEFTNRILIRKSFSWISLLSTLEESLPDNVIILSLRPELRERRVEVALDIAAKTVGDLIAFLKALKENNFENIQIRQEKQDRRGVVLSTITFQYLWEKR